METIKTTTKNYFEALLSYANGGDMAYEAADGTVVPVTNEMLAEFAAKNIDALVNKAAKAKERQQKKAAEADTLLDVVYGALTDEFAPIADITLRIGDEEVTVGKVVNRLGKLAREGKAEKGDIVIPGGDGKKTRHIAGYRRV